MKARHLAAMLLLMAGCAASSAPRFPQTGGTIAVPTAVNRTGSRLLVTGSSVMDRYLLHSETVTAGDVLAGEVRLRLADAGIDVVDAKATASVFELPISDPVAAAAVAAKSDLADEVLVIEIRRWDAAGQLHPDAISVAARMTLVDAASGRTLWHADLPARPFPTHGVVNAGEADVVVAREVVSRLLGKLERDRP